MISDDLVVRAHQKISECLDLATEAFGREFEFPKVKFTKGGRVAGIARPESWEVNYNPVLFAENVEDFLLRTVPHEVAHLIDYAMHPENFTGYGRRSIHGLTFKKIMRYFGAPEATCHSYDTSSVSQKRKSFRYVCPTCSASFELGSARHRKMQAGHTRYWKRGCQRHDRAIYQPSEENIMATKQKATRQTAAAPKAETTTKVEKPKATKKESKLDICRKLYAANAATMERKALIELFIEKSGATTISATKYFQVLNRKPS